MEDDDIDTSSGASLLPVALAVLAIVLGGAGLYFGMTANQRLTPLAESMQAGSSSAARVEKDIAALETRVAELSAQNSEFKETLSRVRLYGNQNEKAVKQLASGVQENRGEIVKLAGRLNQLLADGVTSRAAPERAPSTTADDRPDVGGTSPESEGDETANESTYTIEAGDTLNKVAGKLGIGLQTLLDANPGVDPRRLRIGQVINVPSE